MLHILLNAICHGDAIYRKQHLVGSETRAVAASKYHRFQHSDQTIADGWDQAVLKTAGNALLHRVRQYFRRFLPDLQRSARIPYSECAPNARSHFPSIHLREACRGHGDTQFEMPCTTRDCLFLTLQAKPSLRGTAGLLQRLWQPLPSSTNLAAQGHDRAESAEQLALQAITIRLGPYQRD